MVSYAGMRVFSLSLYRKISVRENPTQGRAFCDIYTKNVMLPRQLKQFF